jgi:hypothetical protein
MSDVLKVTVIIVVAALLGEGMWIFFSPFYSCVRNTAYNAAAVCATYVTPGNAYPH